MAVLPLHKYFILNGELKSAKLFVSSENQGAIYEVLRVVKGIPLFLEDHLQRFHLSAQLAGKTILYSDFQIKNFLEELISRSKVFEGNVIISCKSNLEMFFIQHRYPTAEMYATGVTCGVLKAERENPNAKVFQTTVRMRTDQLLAEKKYFEVLLIDHLGKVTEGSRSNVFFVSESGIVTPPSNKVLMGITRQKTLQLAKNLGFDVIEREVGFSELHYFDAAFLTGTSPKILPVAKIDAFKFDQLNDVVTMLIKGYDELIDDYLKNSN